MACHPFFGGVDCGRDWWGILLDAALGPDRQCVIKSDRGYGRALHASLAGLTIYHNIQGVSGI